jgi:hypothetical protein
VSFDPEPRVRAEPPEDDIVALGLNATDLARIDARPWVASNWPPRHPKEGEFIAFAGLPRAYRVDEAGGRVNFAIVGGLLRVIDSKDRVFRCHMNRESIIKTRGPDVPPPGTEFGGMSGGPVFIVTDGALELAGIITRFAVEMEVFEMTPLSLAEWS